MIQKKLGGARKIWISGDEGERNEAKDAYLLVSQK